MDTSLTQWGKASVRRRIDSVSKSFDDASLGRLTLALVAINGWKRPALLSSRSHGPSDHLLGQSKRRTEEPGDARHAVQNCNAVPGHT